MSEKQLVYCGPFICAEVDTSGAFDRPEFRRTKLHRVQPDGDPYASGHAVRECFIPDPGYGTERLWADYGVVIVDPSEECAFRTASHARRMAAAAKFRDDTTREFAAIRERAQALGGAARYEFGVFTFEDP